MEMREANLRNPSRRYDAIVVGSGPAGSSAAWALVRRGARVCIVEKAEPPRDKICGGGVVQRAADLVPLDLPSVCERELYAAEMNFLDAGLHFAVRRDQPIVSMVSRDRFDYALLSAAIETGAELVAPCHAIAAEEDGGRVVLRTSRESLASSFLVVADGAGGTLARRCGWSAAPDLIPAVDLKVYASAATHERLADSARFDFDVGTNGYAWVFPKRNHLSVGILSTRRGRFKLNHLVRRYMQQVGLDNVEHVERRGFLIPTVPRKEGFQKGRVLLVGDAAGFVDPVAAEGISRAIRSGQLAAQAVLRGQGDPDRVRVDYERALKAEILGELKFGRFLAQFLYRSPRVCRWFFRRQGQALCEAMTEVVLGHQTYRQLLTRPGNHLKLLLGLAKYASVP